MTEFHFLRPLWLLLLPLPPLLAWWRLRRGGDDPWRGLVDPPLLRYLRPARPGGPGRRLPGWIAAAALVAILALAGPAWERVPPPLFRSATPPLVMVLDLSRSMHADDLPPSRLVVARSALHALLERLPPRETGLVVFAGGAHRVMPLTEDRRLLQTLLPRLDSDLMPVQGSNPAAGLTLARRLLERAGSPRGEVLLVTDGADADAVAAAQALARAGYRLLILGLGTPGGGPRRDDGTPPPLERPALEALAEAGDGRYLEWSDPGGSLDALLAALAPAVPAAAEATAQGAGVWRDRGPWLLLLLLPLAAGLFRRGLLLLLLAPLLLPPVPAEAGWQAWWATPDQRARGLLEQGRYREAAALFQDPRWRGVALYLAGDYAAAADAFGAADDALAHYDRGNALLRLGRTREAVAAYREALKRNPDYDKARRNLALARELLAADGKEDEAPPLTLPRPPQARAGGARPDAQPRGSAGAADVPPDREPGNPPREPLPPAAGADDDRGARQPAPGSTPAGGSGPAGSPPPDSVPPGRREHGGRQRPPSEKRSPPRPADAQGRAEAPRPSPPGDTVPPPLGNGAAPGQQGGGAAGERTAGEPPGDAPPERPKGEPDAAVTQEEQRATRNWLQRVPDEPAGLLRELFLREHRRGQDMSRDQEDPW